MKPTAIQGLSGRTGPSGAGDSGVRVLSRGLMLLKAFGPRNLPMSNGELAQATSLPRATVSRITETLTRLRYLDYFAPSATYRLGVGALTLGFGALASVDIRVRARPHMQSFADREDLLVALATRDDMAMVCHEVCRGRGALTIRVGVGSRLLLPHSAMGRAWIACLPATEQAAMLDELELRFPSDGLRPLLAEAAREVHELGFCVTVSSLEPDVNSVATMIESTKAPRTYLLGCSVPAFRYPPERCRRELGPRLLALRREVEHALAPAEPG